MSNTHIDNCTYRFTRADVAMSRKKNPVCHLCTTTVHLLKVKKNEGAMLLLHLPRLAAEDSLLFHKHFHPADSLFTSILLRFICLLCYSGCHKVLCLVSLASCSYIYSIDYSLYLPMFFLSASTKRDRS